jgi:ATP-dependent Clp protease ATP-binding subunit ClpA
LLGVGVERAREAVQQRVKPGVEPSPEMIPFTPRAQQVLARTSQEAADLGRKDVDTEHILLALVTVNEGEAINALHGLAIDAEQVRTEVMREISSPRVKRRAPRASTRGGRRRPSAPPVTEAQHGQNGFRVAPGDDLLRLLMITAARALEDGRTEMTARDLLIALSRDDRTGPLSASLGADEISILAALDHRDPRSEPPEAISDS